MHLVLHHREESLRRLDARVVVNAGRVDVEHLAPEHLFRGPDIPDTREQFVKVVPATATLEAFIVQREPLDQVLAKPLRRPDPELCAPVRPHAVADRDDDVEVVELDLAAHLAIALALNHCKICNGSLPGEFSLVEHVCDVARDDRFVPLEQLGHLAKRQPGRLAIEANPRCASDRPPPGIEGIRPRDLGSG